MKDKIIAILLGKKEQILNNWLNLLLAIPGTNYLKRPHAELLASAEESLHSYIEVFKYSSKKRLEEYVHSVCMTRIKMGFEISEVTQALLLAKEAALPYLIEGFAKNCDELEAAITLLDQSSRWAVALFNQSYSNSLNEQLQQNLDSLKKHGDQLARQKKELEQKVNQISSLIKSARLVNSTLELDKVLKYIVDEACALIGTEMGVLYEIDETAKELNIRAAQPDGLNAKKYENIKILIEKDFIRLMSRNESSLSINDVGNEQRNKLQFLITPLKQENIRAMLAVPLVRKESSFGGIALFYGKPYEFSNEEISLLSTFSAHAALAIENARLYEKCGQTAVLKERNRLAREIHDTLAQGLAGILLQLEAIDRLISRDPNKARVEIQKVKAATRNNLKEARRSVWGLRAGDFIQLSLIDSIQAEIEKIRMESNLEFSFDVKGEIYALSPDAENNLFRIVQESVNNVLQHGHAAHVWIKLIFGIEVFTIHVKDDGIGLKSIQGKKKDVDTGFGLMGMQERARFLNGQLKIDSSEGKGTTITIHIPARTWQNFKSQAEVLED